MLNIWQQLLRHRLLQPFTEIKGSASRPRMHRPCGPQAACLDRTVNPRMTPLSRLQLFQSNREQLVASVGDREVCVRRGEYIVVFFEFETTRELSRDDATCRIVIVFDTIKSECVFFETSIFIV